MGPITLFDKSFLQSLSLDESVWFDAFFMAVVSPIFFVETLADLAKEHQDRSADSAVRIIAQKTPELSGGPCIFHIELAKQSLLGFDIPMDGRVPRPGGRYVRGGGRTGVVYDESPEAKAFSRWQAEQFWDVERLFAAFWRKALESADLNQIANILRKLGMNSSSCKSLSQARSMAAATVDGTGIPYERISMALRFLQIPQQYHSRIFQNWEQKGRPALSAFAPYAAHVIQVEIFFQLALASNLISTDRPSNRADIAYLFYLPFCMIFTSSDKLHRRCAAHFMRPDQEFVWGPDLKADLKRINSHYMELPEEEKEKGVIRLASHPPTEGDYLTTALWKRLMAPTAFSGRDHSAEMDEVASRKLVDKLTAFTKGETLTQAEDAGLPHDSEAMSIERKVHRRKGSWYLVPKYLPDPPSCSPKSTK